jgi:hypothetical protein
MERTLRQRLEHLANELHLHRGQGDERIDAAHADVDAALQDEQHDDLRTRLERHAVALETDHPKMAALVRGVVDSLTSAGL